MGGVEGCGGVCPGYFSSGGEVEWEGVDGLDVGWAVSWEYLLKCRFVADGIVLFGC